VTAKLTAVTSGFFTPTYFWVGSYKGRGWAQSMGGGGWPWPRAQGYLGAARVALTAVDRRPENETAQN